MSKEIITANETMPEYLKGYTDIETGADCIGVDDVTKARLKARHAMGKDLNAEDKKKIPEGDFYNSVTKEHYGNMVAVYPLYEWKSLVWFDEGQKFLASRSFYNFEDAQSIEDKGEMKDQIDEDKFWKKRQEGYNFMLVFQSDIKKMAETGEVATPLLYSTMSSANKNVKKQFNPIIKLRAKKGIPIYVNKIEIMNMLTAVKTGTANIPEFDFSMGLAPEPEFKALKLMFDNLKTSILGNSNNGSEVMN